MDIWVNFTNATKWQAEGIFKCFFLPRPSVSTNETTSADTLQMNLPGAKREQSDHTGSVLDELEISKLAERFADAIPEGEMSVWLTSISRAVLCSHGKGSQVAGLQGYLLKNKTRPRECVEEVAEWCGASTFAIVREN